ncbi:O-antigen ligase family protein [Vibrio vulnificus]|nr:O-antigen ligase family protein [Vibrio vulnificus]
MNSAPKYPHLIFIATACMVLSVIWYLQPNPLIILVLCFLPIAILYVLNQTFWLVLLFVVFSFFRIHEAIPQLYSLKIPLLLSFGALAALSWHLVITKQIQPYWHPAMNWLMLFWAIVFIGLFFAGNRGVAFDAFKGVYWKIIVMTLAIAWLVTTAKHLNAISLVITLSGLLIGTVALSNAAQGIGLVEGSRVTIGRDLGSMLGDPNDLALVLMFPFAFSVSISFHRQNRFFVRTVAIITCLVLFLALLETQSRGGLLGSMAVLGYFANKTIRNKSLLLLLGLVGSLLLYAVAGISDRASGGAGEEGIDASAMGRLYAWEAAFKMALAHPLLGVGLQNFYYNYFFYSPHWDGLNHAVHSTWFGVLAETGFLGLAVFVALIVCLIKTSLRSIAAIRSDMPAAIDIAANAVFAGLLGTIVSGTFLTQGFTWPIYILTALTIAISQIIKSDSQIEKTSS